MLFGRTVFEFTLKGVGLNKCDINVSKLDVICKYGYSADYGYEYDHYRNKYDYYIMSCWDKTDR